MLHRTAHHRFAAVAFAAFAATAVQCSSNRDHFDEVHDAGQAGQFVAPPDAADADADADAADPIPKECAGENTQLYVVSPYPDALYRFDPATLTFTRIGYLDCLHTGVFSMAVDRRGVAWVLFSTGQMANVRLDNLHCTDVPLIDKPEDLNLFGMGFAKDSSATGESLFLHQRRLLRVDPTTRKVAPVGQPGGLGGAELTGTGDGQLFAYWPYNGTIAHLDKETGASLKVFRTSAVDANDWAFAQWGGDFWIFTRRDPSASATVTRFSPATGESKVVIEDTGMRIVGAGSSTCAPSKPVN